MWRHFNAMAFIFLSHFYQPSNTTTKTDFSCYKGLPNYCATSHIWVNCWIFIRYVPQCRFNHCLTLKSGFFFGTYAEIELHTELRKHSLCSRVQSIIEIHPIWCCLLQACSMFFEFSILHCKTFNTLTSFISQDLSVFSVWFRCSFKHLNPPWEFTLN